MSFEALGLARRRILTPGGFVEVLVKWNVPFGPQSRYLWESAYSFNEKSLAQLSRHSSATGQQDLEASGQVSSAEIKLWSQPDPICETRRQLLKYLPIDPAVKPHSTAVPEAILAYAEDEAKPYVFVKWANSSISSCSWESLKSLSRRTIITLFNDIALNAQIWERRSKQSSSWTRYLLRIYNLQAPPKLSNRALILKAAARARGASASSQLSPAPSGSHGRRKSLEETREIKRLRVCLSEFCMDEALANRSKQIIPSPNRSSVPTRPMSPRVPTQTGAQIPRHSASPPRQMTEQNSLFAETASKPGADSGRKLPTLPTSDSPERLWKMPDDRLAPMRRNPPHGPGSTRVCDPRPSERVVQVITAPPSARVLVKPGQAPPTVLTRESSGSTIPRATQNGRNPNQDNVSQNRPIYRSVGEQTQSISALGAQNPQLISSLYQKQGYLPEDTANSVIIPPLARGHSTERNEPRQPPSAKTGPISTFDVREEVRRQNGSRFWDIRPESSSNADKRDITLPINSGFDDRPAPKPAVEVDAGPINKPPLPVASDSTSSSRISNRVAPEISDRGSSTRVCERTESKFGPSKSAILTPSQPLAVNVRPNTVDASTSKSNRTTSPPHSPRNLPADLQVYNEFGKELEAYCTAKNKQAVDGKGRQFCMCRLFSKGLNKEVERILARSPTGHEMLSTNIIKCRRCKTDAHARCHLKCLEWQYLFAHQRDHDAKEFVDYLKEANLRKWRDAFVCAICKMVTADPFCPVEKLFAMTIAAPSHEYSFLEPPPSYDGKMSGGRFDCPLRVLVNSNEAWAYLDQGMRLQLRSIRLKFDGGSGANMVSWAHPKFPNWACDIYTQFGASERKEVIAKPGHMRLRQDSFIMITDDVLKYISNSQTATRQPLVRVQGEFDGISDGPYLVALAVVQTDRNTDFWTREIRTRCKLPLAVAKEFVCQKFFGHNSRSANDQGDDDDDELDIINFETHLKLTCPSTMLRIGVPARSLNCAHVQCFDLEYFIHSQTTTHTAQRWRCPVCYLSCRPHEILIDTWFQGILAQTKEDDKVVDICLKDGELHWTVVGPKTRKKAALPTEPLPLAAKAAPMMNNNNAFVILDED